MEIVLRRCQDDSEVAIGKQQFQIEMSCETLMKGDLIGGRNETFR